MVAERHWIGNRHRILAQVEFLPVLPKFGVGRRNLTNAVGFRQSDTKIRGLSAIDLSYQRTLMFDGSGFPQTRMQE
jgi:hypothetical protein